MRHVIADVIFHELTHKAIDGAACRGKALEHISARFVGVESAQNAVELTNYFLGAVNEVEFFSRSVAHILLTTLWGYGIKVRAQEARVK